MAAMGRGGRSKGRRSGGGGHWQLKGGRRGGGGGRRCRGRPWWERNPSKGGCCGGALDNVRCLRCTRRDHDAGDARAFEFPRDAKGPIRHET